MEELLSPMKEAQKDVHNSKSTSRKASQEQKAEKELLGAIVRAKAMHRVRISSTSDAEVEGTEGESSDAVTTAKKRSPSKTAAF